MSISKTHYIVYIAKCLKRKKYTYILIKIFQKTKQKDFDIDEINCLKKILCN